MIFVLFTHIMVFVCLFS